MTPLWTTATAPLPPRCGWAFTSVGAPWVAQRVWPMPICPVEGVSASRRWRLSMRPADLVSVEAVGGEEGGDAGAVVAAVLEAAKPVDEDTRQRHEVQRIRRFRTWLGNSSCGVFWGLSSRRALAIDGVPKKAGLPLVALAHCQCEGQ